MDSYRLIPAAPATSETSTASTSHAALTGIHDSLRHGGPRSLSAEHAAQHPLQTRLQGWEETQDNLKFDLQRNLYGMHMPIRQMMERKLVGFNSAFPVMSSSVTGVHLDILRGKDETLDESDVLVSREQEALGRMQSSGDMHQAMEQRLRL